MSNCLKKSVVFSSVWRILIKQSYKIGTTILRKMKIMKLCEISQGQGHGVTFQEVVMTLIKRIFN
jgi:hypothetical protein